MKFLKNIEKWLFYLLVFSLPLQLRLILHSFGPVFNEWNSIYFYATDILAISVIFLWLARTTKNRKWNELFGAFGKIEIALGLLLLFSAFSMVVALNFKLSFYGFAKLFEFCLLFLYIKFNFQRLYNLEKFWQIFIASAVLQSALAIFQFFWQKSLGLKFLSESPLSPEIAGVAKILVGGEKIIRAYGLFPHPNILAAFLVAAIFGLALLFIKNYKQLKVAKKIAIGAIFILIFFALILTFSRTVFLAGSALFFLWLLYCFFKKGHKRPVIILSLFFILCSLFFLAVMWPYLSARYDAAGLGKSQSFNLRFLYLKMAKELIKGEPIFGIGQGNFVWITSMAKVFANWVYQPVHNIYILILAETGILGLLAFLWFLFLNIKKAFKSLSDKLVVYNLLLIVSVFLIVSFFDHFFWTLQQGQLLLWLFLGILASYSCPRS